MKEIPYHLDNDISIYIKPLGIRIFHGTSTTHINLKFLNNYDFMKSGIYKKQEKSFVKVYPNEILFLYQKHD